MLRRIARGDGTFSEDGPCSVKVLKDLDRGVVGHEHVSRSEERCVSGKWMKVFLMGIVDNLYTSTGTATIGLLYVVNASGDRGLVGNERVCLSEGFSIVGKWMKKFFVGISDSL